MHPVTKGLGKQFRPLCHQPVRGSMQKGPLPSGLREMLFGGSLRHRYV